MKARAALFVAVVGVLGAGCSATNDARARAIKLETDLLQYQADQQARINSLNQQYRATYAALVANLEAAETLQRDLQFREDSQRIADHLIADWPKSTQPTQLHDSFGAALAAQLKRVRANDDEIAAQKAAYAASFQALSTQLKKLDEARRSLRALATRDNLEENLQLLMDLVQTAGKDLEKVNPR